MNVGEVWRVDYPFEDDDTKSKERPCIIIDLDEDTVEVLVIKVTHHDQRDNYDIPIFKWRAANLLEPSYARVSKVAYVNKNDFIKKYGELDCSDFRNIFRAFKQYISK